ncbi:uncharacterized protein LOC117790948 [Drosophila innubila]|uniref:uncharacterized protein LOC117790948 n=1 Tax=Drosophila innubila TaxID=198719 RepID=UPI00148E1590|nr:uncharacterized protein LOC117790948 [Drosophila innubila]
MCGQCPDWKLDQDHDPIIRNPAHKLMTTAECMRLKRDLRVSFFTHNGGSNIWTFIMLVFFILICMALTFWLLTKAFVFSQPQRDDTEENNSQDRQLGGRSSVDEIMQQLREKCTASTQNVENKAIDIDDLYVPPKFWDRFPMNEFLQKPNRTKQKSKKEEEVETEEDSKAAQNMEVDSETSNETSDVESTETSFTEVLNESQDMSEVSSTSEETTRSSGGESEQSTDGEDSTSMVIDNQQNIHDSLGQMPTYYNHTTANPTPDQSRRKIRWANWLKRSKPVDFQTYNASKL